MEAVAMSPSTVSSHTHDDHDAASVTEAMSLQEGLLFSDTLKDLRNLRSQLYSAAEYFEVFYRNNSHKSTYESFSGSLFPCLSCLLFASIMK